ncbi:MAG: capsule biosynthesis protein, partial [Myxococcota bacterium]
MTPARVLKSLRARLFPVPAYPHWNRVLMRDGRRWRQAIDESKEGPRILIATSFGGHLPSVHLETTLAVALTLRGANVHLLLCDSVLPACQLAEFAMFDNPRSFIEEGPQARLCPQCFAPAAPVFNSLGLTVHTYRQWLGADDGAEVATLVRSTPQDRIKHLRIDGLAVGEHAVAGALRFFARGDISQEEHAESVLARYLEAALLTIRGVRNLLRAEDIGVACFNHGIYVPQGLIAETARQEGARVVTWNPAYRKGCF